MQCHRYNFYSFTMANCKSHPIPTRKLQLINEFMDISEKHNLYIRFFLYVVHNVSLFLYLSWTNFINLRPLPSFFLLVSLHLSATSSSTLIACPVPLVKFLQHYFFHQSHSPSSPALPLPSPPQLTLKYWSRCILKLHKFFNLG